VPDLARGLGLLGITVVNAPLLAPREAVDTVDRVSSVIVTGLLENRSWPMFALMFGFGIAAIAARMDRQGFSPEARNRMLRRRNWWLFAFGLIQVLLVFWGDILAVYGLTGMAVIMLMHRSARTRLIFGAVSAALWFGGNVVLNLGGSSDDVPSSPDYLTSILERLAVFGFWTGLNSVALTHLAPMLMGVALFNRGALHRPVDHVALHRRLAAWGLIIGVMGALPLCFIRAGGWRPSDQIDAVAIGLHALTGIAQGVGYVSLIALWSARHSVVGVAPRGCALLLSEIGRRSLTVYFVHSILLGLLLSPWAFDLAPSLSLASSYLVGLGVWLACATVALVLYGYGRPGPADVLLRRLSYGRSITDGEPRGR
jgi:uncharacterized membrane protein YeiB